MADVTFYNPKEIDDSLLKFAVLAAKCGGQWIFCRHKDRTTWELAGGHRETGEAIAETARRELLEETGTVEAVIRPVCVYKAADYGMLYFAEVLKRNSLPGEFEIAETLLADTLPEALTYPGIHDKLFAQVQKWLECRSRI